MRNRSPWSWIPSLYFAEGMPYTVVMILSVVFYKRMGISNTDIALYTSWLYLPWVIKPLWSPVVDILKTRRYWILAMQLLIGAGLGCFALAIPLPDFFRWTLVCLWLMAFSSATHDIAADGFYMLGLSEHDQSWFVGLRSTFYRLAMITGQGLLIMVAGLIEQHTGLPDKTVEVVVGAPSSGYEMRTNSTLDSHEGLQIIVEPQQLKISQSAVVSEKLDSFLAEINSWNQARSERTRSERTRSERTRSDQARSKEMPSTQPGYPTVSPQDGGKGENGAVIAVSLSAPPEGDRPLVVTMGQKSGRKGIRLLTDSRFEFDRENWNHPFLAVVQIDPSLKSGDKASFYVRSGHLRLAWGITFGILGALFIFFFLYHNWALPKPISDKSGHLVGNHSLFGEFLNVFGSFFRKPGIILAIIFILVYRLGEAQLVKVAPLFMLDRIESGGLALTTAQYGFVYGTLGTLALTIGGILGGWVASRKGLKFWILWMALAMNIPDAIYVFLAWFQPTHFGVITTSVCIEQFGYGFGFTAYLLYMIHLSEGAHKTAHYAICTGLMALGMMLPGMGSGWIQEHLGYQSFFIWVLLACIPGLLMIRFLKIPKDFGKKEA